MKIFLLSLSILLMSFNLGGSIESVLKENDYPIFLGVIEHIEKEEGNKGYRVLVDGYLKGGVIRQEKIIAIVSEDTEVTMLGDENQVKRFAKGDNVFIEFSKGMTFSIPPQSFARKMEVYRKPSYVNMNITMLDY